MYTLVPEYLADVPGRPVDGVGHGGGAGQEGQALTQLKEDLKVTNLETETHT